MQHVERVTKRAALRQLASADAVRDFFVAFAPERPAVPTVDLRGDDLADRVVELEAMPPVSRELVRTTLKKTGSNRGGSNGG